MPRISTSSPTEISTLGCTIALWSRLSAACERSQHTCVCPSCDSGLCRAIPLCIACKVKVWITAGQTRQEHSFCRQPLRPSRYASCHAVTPVEVVQPADYWQQLNHAAGKQQMAQVSTLPAQQPPVGSLYCSTGWRRRFIRQQSSQHTHAVGIMTDDDTRAQGNCSRTHTDRGTVRGAHIHFEPRFG